MERINIKGMIESVINDLSLNEPIQDYALKIKLIAYYVKNKKFSNWVKNELEGYIDINDLPSYRLINTQIIANILIDNGVKSASIENHVMPLASLNNAELIKELSTIKLKESILGLEKMAMSNKGLGYTITEYERYHLNKIYEYSTILSAHKRLSSIDCENAIFAFKSTLLDLFVELNDTIFNDQLDFDIMSKKQEVEKIVSQTINTGIYISDNGIANVNSSQVVGGNNNKLVIPDYKKEELKEIIDQIDNLSRSINEYDEITDEIIKIKIELERITQNPKMIKSALNAIKGIAVGVGANQLTPYVSKGLDWLKTLLE